jgi:translation initiation factor IF-3
LRLKNTNNVSKKEQAQLINEKIKAPQVQLITHEGENIGVVSRDKALQMAFEADLDLVQISDEGKEGVPVAKIMDLGKTLYERKKKQNDAKKHQKTIQIKEIKVRPKIGEHDYQTKIKQMIQFLKDGKRVKITLTFRGRENVSRDEKGLELFQKIQNTLTENDLIDSLVQEKDDVAGKLWSRIYYLKSK